MVLLAGRQLQYDDETSLSAFRIWIRGNHVGLLLGIPPRPTLSRLTPVIEENRRFGRAIAVDSANELNGVRIWVVELVSIGGNQELHAIDCLEQLCADIALAAVMRQLECVYLHLRFALCPC